MGEGWQESLGQFTLGKRKTRDALDMVGNNSHGCILNIDVTRSNWYFANFKISILYRIGWPSDDWETGTIDMPSLE